MKWFTEAAKDGDALSEAILGYSYYTGTELCTVKDYTKSIDYLLRAVNNRDFENQVDFVKSQVYRALAGSYRYGRGCEADQSLASYYTEKAAQYGDTGSKRATSLIRRE